jgi:hypothetical protein
VTTPPASRWRCKSARRLRSPVVNGKTQIGRVARCELAENHQLQPKDFPAKMPKRSDEQIEANTYGSRPPPIAPNNNSGTLKVDQITRASKPSPSATSARYSNNSESPTPANHTLTHFYAIIEPAANFAIIHEDVQRLRYKPAE